MDSKQFFINRLQSGFIHDDIVEISKIQEISPFEFIKEEISSVTREVIINKHKLKVNYLYSSDADFDYCAMTTCQHDGTYSFVLETIQRCLTKLHLETYFNEKLPPILCDEVTYTFGNLLVFNEYRPDLAPDDRKWMAQRTSVYLPVKYDVVKSSENKENKRD